MYLAQFSIDEVDYVQAVLRVSVTLDSLGDVEGSKHQVEQFVAALASLPCVWITHRISLRGAQLDRYWFVTVPAVAEESLRRWCVGLVRVVRDAPSFFRLVEGRDAYDALMAIGPANVARIELPVYQVATSPAGGITWLGGRFRLAEHIDALLQHALLDGRDLVFQATFSRQEVQIEVLRELRKNLIRLYSAPGVGDARRASFAAVVEKYAASSHRATELIGCGGALPNEWLREAFHQLTVPVHFLPDLDSSPDCAVGRELAIDLNVPGDAPSAALASVDFADLARTLAWTSSRLPSALFLEERVRAAEYDDSLDQSKAFSAPPASEQPHQFVFVSYCRRDAAALEHVVESLRDAGHNPWWDHQIPGGATWLQMLEQRLDECVAVVALVSEAAGKSRFVRDELTYAHIIGKPVVPIRLDAAPLAGGLRLILTQRNWIDVAASDLAMSLKVALAPAA